MKILFIASISLVVVSVILFIISKVVYFIYNADLFEDILDGETDSVNKENLDALDELKAASEMLGNGLSRFKYSLLLLYLSNEYEAVYQFRSNGWKVGLLGGTALYATYHPSSFFDGVFIGFIISLVVIFCLNLVLNILVKVLLYFRCKYIYNHERSQSQE